MFEFLYIISLYYIKIKDLEINQVKITCDWV